MDSTIDDIKGKAAELANHYAKTVGNCAQCTVVGTMEALENGPITKDVAKAATGFGGGIGKLGAACGAFTGGTLCLSSYAGRDYDGLKKCEGNNLAFVLTRELADRFLDEYGGYSCMEVQKRILGESYLLADPDQAQKYMEAGGGDEKCPLVCGNAARWVIEILDENDLL